MKDAPLQALPCRMEANIQLTEALEQQSHIHE
jgi:hypothetical protein